MKKVELTVEEWQRLEKVTLKERDRALRKLQRWVHHEIIHRGFNQEIGPFSPGAIGGDAVEVICNECLEALFCGEWHWKPSRELSSMLIQIAKSKMGHIIDDFYDLGKTEVTLTSEQSFREEVDMDIAAQWKFEANMRDWGYEIAREKAKNHPELLAYLDAMFKDDTYIGIASLLGVEVKVVMKLEKQMLSLLKDVEHKLKA